MIWLNLGLSRKMNEICTTLVLVSYLRQGIELPKTVVPFLLCTPEKSYIWDFDFTELFHLEIINE